MKTIKSVILTILNSILIFSLSTGYSFGQTATLLPNAQQQFLDNNANPVASGTVDFYIPGTTTRKTTWQDAAETIPNTNPVVLDAAGRALIYGFGAYRQVLKDVNSNLIWDRNTNSYSVPNGGNSTGDGLIVGSVLPWSGLIAPNQYQFAYGQEISRTTFDVLFSTITVQQTGNCTLGSNVISGVGDTTQIPIGAKIEASCFATSSTVTSKTSSTYVVTLNAIATSSVTFRAFPYGNGNGTTTYNLPDFRGRVLAGRDNMGNIAAARLTSTYYNSNPDALAAVGGSENHTLTQSELSVNLGTASSVVTDPGHTHALRASSSVGNTSTPTGNFLATNAIYRSTADLLMAATSASSSVTGVTVATTITNSTGGNPHSIVQPSITVNYIVKTTPDTSNLVATGVMSLGGMTGAIACGDFVTCVGNIISFNSSTLFAPPSASVGLTTVNGSAVTAMRSDAAPALNQGINPTWTGTHTFNTLPNLFGTSGYAFIGNGVSGASFQAFQSSSSNSVARTWQSKADDFLNVLDFGANSGDVTTLFTNAFAAQRTLHVLSGAYTINSTPTYNNNSGSIWGSGATFSGAGAGVSCSTKLCGPLGSKVSTTATGSNTSTSVVLNVTTTTGVQTGMLITSQQISGTDGTLSTTSCIQRNTSVTSINSATQVGISLALACDIPSTSSVYFSVTIPTLKVGPNSNSFYNVADVSVSLADNSLLKQTTALQLQTVTAFAGNPSAGNQSPTLFIREEHTANTGVNYGSCASGGCTGPTTTFNPLGGIQIAQNLDGDGSVNLFNTAQHSQGTPKEGFQSTLGWQGTQDCNASGLFCQQRVIELSLQDDGVPAQQTGFIARMQVNSTTPGLDKVAFYGACNGPGNVPATPCTSVMTAGNFGGGNSWLSGLNFAGFLTANTSWFTTNEWARVSNGDGIYSVTHGKGSLKYIYLVANTAGRGCTGAGTAVNLVISGGGGAGATGKAILSNSGSVLIAYVTAGGTGYTSAPSVSYTTGCASNPSFGSYVQYDAPTLVTTSTGITQIWGADLTGVTPVGTIQLMNASTSAVMASYVGNTGGGMQLGAAPTGGDQGAGSMNSTGSHYINGTRFAWQSANGTWVQTTIGSVAQLPTCNAAAGGTRGGVNNATVTTFMTTVVGGGANIVPVFCDGTNWKIG